MSEATDLSETDGSNTTITGTSVAEGTAMSNLNNGIRNLAGLLARAYNRLTGEYASTGSANAYVVTPAVALAAYVTGERYSWRANFTNTSGCTVNFSALGAKTIKRYAGGTKINLDAGNIQLGQPITAEYDGTDMIPVTPLSGNILVQSAAGDTATLDLYEAGTSATITAELALSGNNSSPAKVIYGRIQLHRLDSTAGTEDARLDFSTIVAGTSTVRAYISQGLVVDVPSGTLVDKGVGTVNATAVYDDNVLLTDYVFDILLDGEAKAEDGERGETFDPLMLDVAKYAAFWTEHRRLPAMPSREEWRRDGPRSTGDLISRLWETVEVQAVHISKLDARLARLELLTRDTA
jgi:hypothetical protein